MAKEYQPYFDEEVLTCVFRICYWFPPIRSFTVVQGNLCEESGEAVAVLLSSKVDDFAPIDLSSLLDRPTSSGAGRSSCVGDSGSDLRLAIGSGVARRRTGRHLPASKARLQIYASFSIARSIDGPSRTQNEAWIVLIRKDGSFLASEQPGPLFARFCFASLLSGPCNRRAPVGCSGFPGLLTAGW